MGRPLYRTVAGIDARQDYTGAAVGIRVDAYFGGSLRNDVFIINQKRTRGYLVQDKSDSTQAVCNLVSGTPAANGQMRMIGLLNGAGSAQIAIAKLGKRIAIDFSGNRYNWSLSNDSSGDYIILTPIATYPYTF